MADRGSAADLLSLDMAPGGLSAEASGQPREMLGATRFQGLTAAYGWAHFGKSLFWYASEILFAFFLTEVGGLSGRGMGLVIALGLLTSVVIDLTLAWLFRRALAEIRSAGRLQLLGAAFSAFALGALFLTPWIGDEEAKFAFALAAMLVFRLAYALYDLPQNVLLALATVDASGRTRVATLRLFFSGLATLLVSALAALLVAEPQAGRAGRFLAMAVGISLLALASAWRLHKALAAQATDRSSALPPPAAGTARPGAVAAGTALLVATFVVSLTGSLFTKLEPYLAAYVLQSPLWGGVIIATTALGTTLSQPAWSLVSARWPRPTVFAMAAGLLAFAALAFLTVKASIWAGVAAAFLFGAASGGLGAIMWAGWGDVVADWSARVGGLAFALFTGASKIGLALSGLTLGVALHSFDYRDRGNDLIVTLMALCPALGGAVCLAIAGIWRVAGIAKGRTSLKGWAAFARRLPAGPKAANLHNTDTEAP